MATTFTFAATAAASTPSATARWSVATLAAHLLGEVNQDRAAAGTVPDRFSALVVEGLRTMWDAADWVWQMATTTLAISIGDSSEQMAEDFRKLNSKWVSDNEKSASGLVFTTSPHIWQRVRSEYKDDATGEPIIACILMDTSETATDRYKAMLCPTSSVANTYDYVYQR